MILEFSRNATPTEMCSSGQGIINAAEQHLAQHGHADTNQYRASTHELAPMGKSGS